jgi:hypothetical protein
MVIGAPIRIHGITPESPYTYDPKHTYEPGIGYNNGMYIIEDGKEALFTPSYEVAQILERKFNFKRDSRFVPCSNGDYPEDNFYHKKLDAVRSNWKIRSEKLEKQAAERARMQSFLQNRR